MASPSPKRKVEVRFCCCCAAVLLLQTLVPAVPHAMFPSTATPRPAGQSAVEFLREGSRVTAFWDVQKSTLYRALHDGRPVNSWC